MEEIDSEIKFENIYINDNSYRRAFEVNGSISASFDKINIINNNLDLSNKNPFFLKLTIGLAFWILDYKNLTLSNINLTGNLAQNTLQGIALFHSEVDLKSQNTTNTKNIKAIGLIVNLTCYNNYGFIIDTPDYFGNCMMFQISGSLLITRAQVKFNEILMGQNMKSGATSPCMYSKSFTNHINLTESIFDENKGVIGSYCITFIGSSFNLYNVNITNIGDQDSISSNSLNEGGAMNLGAENLTMISIGIQNCKSQRGAGIYFQNQGNFKTQRGRIDKLVIKGNTGKQTSGMEFDVSLLCGEEEGPYCKLKKI